MPERQAISAAATRVRWRLSGAWQWPAFVALTIGDALLLTLLPFSGGHGELVGSLLAAGLANIAIVAVAGRAGGVLVRRARPQLPREIAADRASVIAMLTLSALLLVGGVVHRSALQRDDHRRDRAIELSQRAAAAQAPASYLANLHREDVLALSGRLYRTCFPGRDPRRAFCVYVRFDDGGATRVRVDRDQRPNAALVPLSGSGR
jgi:hypothetical protein